MPTPLSDTSNGRWSSEAGWIHGTPAGIASRAFNSRLVNTCWACLFPKTLANHGHSRARFQSGCHAAAAQAAQRVSRNTAMFSSVIGRRPSAKLSRLSTMLVARSAGDGPSNSTCAGSVSASIPSSICVYDGNSCQWRITSCDRRNKTDGRELLTLLQLFFEPRAKSHLPALQGAGLFLRILQRRDRDVEHQRLTEGSCSVNLVNVPDFLKPPTIIDQNLPQCIGKIL